MEKKFEIAVTLNKYKDTFYALIDSSDTESSDHLDFPNQPELIDKGSRNAPKSREGSSTFLELDCLDKNILIMLLEPIPKIKDSQVH